MFRNLNRMASSIKSAGCLIIGDEVLNGKILDTNSFEFAKYCFKELSIPVKKTVVCGDDADDIIRSLKVLTDENCDFIVTSGGIGSTHDDINGSVHRALNLANQRFFAIKVVVLNEKRLRKIFMEPRIHARMCHRNVAMLKGAFCTETHLNIVQTFYGGGNLRDKIKQAHNCRIDPAEAVKYITQIALGLDHIHRMGVIHRDIKESNIFLLSAGVPKIGDFGIAKEDDPLGINTGYGGTRGWMSPEMIQSTPYTYTTDIWSLGVVCYRLITGKKPFVENDGTTLSERIIVAEYPPSRFLDGAAGDLVEGFLKVDPSLRIRLSDVCEQPWIQQHVWIRSRHKRHRPALNLKSMN